MELCNESKLIKQEARVLLDSELTEVSVATESETKACEGDSDKCSANDEK